MAKNLRLGRLITEHAVSGGLPVGTLKHQQNLNGKTPSLINTITDMLNTRKSAGLPEIYAKYTPVWHWVDGFTASGALNKVTGGKYATGSGGKGGSFSWEFSAKRYNNIYGSSNTVTPESIECYCMIKY